MATRKDFEALAAVIAGEVASAAGNKDRLRTSSNIARSMADKFAQENEFFRREQFYIACGLDKTGGLTDA